MDHNQGKKCKCKIFQNKAISIQILCIHSVIVEIERKLLNFADIITLREQFINSSFNRFIFCAKFEIDPPIRYKIFSVITKGTISSLLWILDNYLSEKYNFLTIIEMIDELTYDKLESQYFENRSKVDYHVFPLQTKFEFLN